MRSEVFHREYFDELIFGQAIASGVVTKHLVDSLKNMRLSFLINLSAIQIVHDSLSHFFPGHFAVGITIKLLVGEDYCFPVMASNCCHCQSDGYGKFDHRMSIFY